MIQLFFLAAFVIAVLAAMLGVRSCEEHRVQPSVPAATFNSEVAILGDGTPMFAPNGTIARALVDWLADPNSTQKYFEVGGIQFAGRSVAPTPEARARLTRLAAMLQGYPNVDAKMIGFTNSSGNPLSDAQLEEHRADLVEQLLVSAGVRRSRLTAAKGGANALPGLGKADPRNERIALLLAFPDRIKGADAR